MIRRLRPVAFLAVALATFFARAGAFADVAPYPQRPDWHDVPAPMPPETMVAIAVAVAMLALVAYRARRV